MVHLDLQQKITALLESEDTVKEATQVIVENIEALPELPDKVQYGHTKIFIKVFWSYLTGLLFTLIRLECLLAWKKSAQILSTKPLKRFKGIFVVITARVCS